MTRAGWATLVGAIALYGAGAFLGQREALVLGVAGVALVVVGLAVATGRPRIEVERRIAPDRVPVGDLAEGFVTVTNIGRGPSPALACRDVVGAGAVEVAVPRLGVGRALTLPYPLPTGRRSIVRVGPMLVARGDAFGLVERRTSHGGHLLLHVHPRVHLLGPLSVGQRRDIEGPTSETERGAMVFHALREYVIGDDLRRVHWKATAHTGQLMVREHVDPSRPGATVVLDDRASAMDADRFELAVEAVASVAVSSLRQGFPVRVLSCSEQLAADGSGRATSGTAGPGGGGEGAARRAGRRRPAPGARVRPRPPAPGHRTGRTGVGGGDGVTRCRRARRHRRRRPPVHGRTGARHHRRTGARFRPRWDDRRARRRRRPPRRRLGGTAMTGR